MYTVEWGGFTIMRGGWEEVGGMYHAVHPEIIYILSLVHQDSKLFGENPCMHALFQAI